MLILLDPAHGHNTPGKRSPDGQLLEYAYTRDLARRIVSILKSRGYDSKLLVPEDDDIPLSERVRRTSAHCQALGKSNVILISLHINAAGNGSKWMNATGWSCYTCIGQTESDRLCPRRRSGLGRKLLYTSAFLVPCSPCRTILHGQ